MKTVWFFIMLLSAFMKNISIKTPTNPFLFFLMPKPSMESEMSTRRTRKQMVTAINSLTNLPAIIRVNETSPGLTPTSISVELLWFFTIVEQSFNS